MAHFALLSLFLLTIFGLVNSHFTAPDVIIQTSLKIYTGEQHNYDPKVIPKALSVLKDTHGDLVHQAHLNIEKKFIRNVYSKSDFISEYVRNADSVYKRLWMGVKNNEEIVDNINTVKNMENLHRMARGYCDFNYLDQGLIKNKDKPTQCQIIDDYRSLIFRVYETVAATERASLVVQLYNNKNVLKLAGGAEEQAKKQAIDATVQRLTQTKQIAEKNYAICIERLKGCSPQSISRCNQGNLYTQSPH